ncbi:MAG: hypothetical protein ACRDSZ_02060 [Pseudonocardiaceae bacterium]
MKNILGAGQARNRVTKTVERTVPFGLLCHSLLIIWHTLNGHAATDTANRPPPGVHTVVPVSCVTCTRPAFDARAVRAC